MVLFYVCLACVCVPAALASTTEPPDRLWCSNIREPNIQTLKPSLFENFRKCIQHACKTLYVSLCIFHCSKNQKKTFGYIFLDTFYMTLTTTTLERKCWWSTTSFCERWIDCANHNSGPVEATRIWVGKYYRCWSLRVFQSECREIHMRYLSALRFWNIKFEKSSLMNWNFCLVWTRFLLPV